MYSRLYIREKLPSESYVLTAAETPNYLPIYEIFKFMRINSNESMEYEIIKLEEINNLCVTAKLIIDKKQRKTGNDTVESCIYLTDCVDFDNFD